MTSFPDVLADALRRIFGVHVAALVLEYTLGPLVSVLVAVIVSLTIGLLVPQIRTSTGLWMGFAAAAAYAGLAIASGVQPRLVTVLEMSFLVGACVVGLGAARWLWQLMGAQKAPPR